MLNRAKRKGVAGKGIFKTLFTIVFIDTKTVKQLISLGFSIHLSYKKMFLRFYEKLEGRLAKDINLVFCPVY